MIRYPVSPAALRRRIDALDPDWRARAETHTDRLELLGRFEEAPNNTSWSRIKRAFVEIQHNKCAWCERKLEDAEHGLIEHDVDHFRPKNAVRAWPPPRHPTTYPFPTGAPLPGGYYLLSYQYENYLTSCKTCNTILKNDGFPIAGARRHPPSRRVADHEAEQPLLPFPLGTRGPAPRSCHGAPASSERPPRADRAGHHRLLRPQRARQPPPGARQIDPRCLVGQPAPRSWRGRQIPRPPLRRRGAARELCAQLPQTHQRGRDPGGPPEGRSGEAPLTSPRPQDQGATRPCNNLSYHRDKEGRGVPKGRRGPTPPSTKWRGSLGW